MKHTFPKSLALLTVVFCCTFTTAAAASAAPGSANATAEKAFHIDMATNRALLHISKATVSRAEKHASGRMTTCLTNDLVQISDASQSNVYANKALELIGEEAGIEYEMAAIKPVLTPLLNGVHRLLTLHLPARLHATVKVYLGAFARVTSLNACADARTWLAGGLTAAHEPHGTARISKTVADFHRLTTGTLQAQLGDLPPDQIRALKVEKTLAGKHVNQLIAGSVSGLESWIKQVEVNVAKATTTTTTTPTTTAPTTTTGTSPTSTTA